VKKTSYHKLGEELYYVLGGSGSAVLNGKKFLLTKGCFFRVPPDTKHQFITEKDSLDLLNSHQWVLFPAPPRRALAPARGKV